MPAYGRAARNDTPSPAPARPNDPRTVRGRLLRYAGDRHQLYADQLRRWFEWCQSTDPAVYARLPKIHDDESRTQGLDRLELIRFLQVAQTIRVHHGAPLAHVLGTSSLRACEAAAVRIEDYHDTLRGHRVLHLIGKNATPSPPLPLAVPVLRVPDACRGQRTDGPLVLRSLS